MKKQITFEDRICAKVREQITGRRTGFLLGAGASFLHGSGYPLADGLWSAVKDQMKIDDQRLIGDQMAQGVSTLEQALDVLDRGRGEDGDLRHRVTSAISATFRNQKPPIDYHRTFVSRLANRTETRIPVFTLNYDLLIERAADEKQLCLVDGYRGIVECCFLPHSFADYYGTLEARRGRLRLVPTPHRGIINLYKLHGSLGWYVDPQVNLKRIHPDLPCPSGWRHLMIPPQNRKAADTSSLPYAMLWSEFRAYLTNDFKRPLNRLVCVGYGFSDGHVNAVILPALARNHFTLVILAKALTDDVYKQWCNSHKVIIVTETRSSLYGEEGPGISDAWAFEWLAEEV